MSNTETFFEKYGNIIILSYIFIIFIMNLFAIIYHEKISFLYFLLISQFMLIILAILFKFNYIFPDFDNMVEKFHLTLLLKFLLFSSNIVSGVYLSFSLSDGNSDLARNGFLAVLGILAIQSSFFAKQCDNCKTIYALVKNPSILIDERASQWKGSSGPVTKKYNDRGGVTHWKKVNHYSGVIQTYSYNYTCKYCNTTTKSKTFEKKIAQNHWTTEERE